MYTKCQFSIIFLKLNAKTAPPYIGAIWEELGEQYEHQSNEKAPYLMPN